MDCDRALDLLSARLDGEDGEAGDEERLDEHLGSCASCRTAQDRMTALHRQLRLRPAEPVADRTTTLLSAIELPWARAVRQRKRRAGIGVGLAASLLLAAAVSGVLWFRSRPPAGPHLHVTDVAASATSEGGTSTVTFTIINHGRGADALVAVEVDPTIATRADLHVVRPFATIANGHDVVLYVWYDNEYGYTRQVIRFAKQLAGVIRLRYY